MHGLNLIHRDLKPLNIFLSDDSDMPRVKIGDLGLAVQIEPGDKIIHKVGTKGFMAPEVAQRGPYDFKADIYSLGLVLYTMITMDGSQFDYKASESPDIHTITVNEDITYQGPVWQSYSHKVVDLLKLMLSPDPEYRFDID